jgi:hypothetical protein
MIATCLEFEKTMSFCGAVLHQSDLLLCCLARAQAGGHAASWLTDIVILARNLLGHDAILVLMTPDNKVNAVVEHCLWYDGLGIMRCSGSKYRGKDQLKEDLDSRRNALTDSDGW